MFRRTETNQRMRWGLLGGMFFCAGAALLAGGCATGTKQARQFEPVPRANVKTDELAPMSNRPVVELLREAAKAFEDGNKAEEAGDHQKALEYYTVMLKRMTEADMDPAVFYSMRKEFGKILNSTHHYAKSHPNQIDSGSPDKGDLRVPFPLPEPVLAEIDFYQHTIPSKFQTYLNRSPRYMPYLRKEFEKAGLPPDLAWLALVESGFNPKVVSPAGAGGLWQFMRATGSRYGLQQDSYIDERNDWKSATRAAIEYLKDLRDQFHGDWALALSAYNMGEGGLQRAINANGGEHDFWTLIVTPPASDRIRLETKRYYPLFLAAMIISSSPERYGFTIAPQAAEETAEVRVRGMYSLAALDKAMGYTPGTLSQLNPELIKEVTPPSREYRLSVPVQDQEKLAQALKDTPQVEMYAKYQVRKGDTLAKVAQQFGMDVRELAQCNKLRVTSSIRKGQMLRVPGGQEARGMGGESEDTKKTPPEEKAKLASTRSENGYTVRPGDTLHEIAKTNGLELRQLQEWNQIGDATVIRPGDRLHLSNPAQPAKNDKKEDEPETGTTTLYAVQPGDTLNKIALKHKVTVKDLREWNGLPDDGLLHVGDTLRLASKGNAAPKSASPPVKPEKASPEVTHVVVKGDTASSIASKYKVKVSDLLAWNSLTPKSVLKVGQKCIVHSGGKSSESSDPAKETKEDAGERTQIAQVEPSAPARKEVKTADSITHVVAKGNNPSVIARQYGVRVSDLFKWNNWPQVPILKVGDEVKVFKK